MGSRACRVSWRWRPILQARMFKPGLSADEGTVALNPPAELNETDVVQDVQRYHAYGHSGSMQPIVRQASPTTSNYGLTYPAGTAVSVRDDFDTLDNPFHTRPTRLETDTP